ncbi:MAG TPA: Crp/Fnr family transcriptional regulator [Terriglobia bacterium]|nr:Crp/Fnr family transcriptional regulator [Terriglobia bacterium]
MSGGKCGGAGPVSSNTGRNDAEIAGTSRLFSGILPDYHSRLCGAGHVRHFSRGETLHFEGDAVRRVLLLTGGLVKITGRSQGGREVILRLSGVGDALGVVGLFSSGLHYTTAEAFQPGRALIWEDRVFRSLAEQFPALRLNALATLGDDLRELEERFREVATERVAARVALQLLRLRQTIGRPVEAGAASIEVSREELAQMTGTTLFTVSRLLSAWEDRGIVKPLRGGVVICDVQSLGTISQEDPPER